MEPAQPGVAPIAKVSLLFDIRRRQHRVLVFLWFGFDKDVDRIVVVFDVDIYKGDERAYMEALAQFDGVAEVAVTNPGFELFLLLHVPNSYEDLIAPHEDELIANARAESGHRRLVSELANKACGMNLKSNPGVARLSEEFDVAAKQEPMLNQSAKDAMGKLTSNVAKVICALVEDGAAKDFSSN